MNNKKLLFVVNVDWFFVSHRLAIAEKAILSDYEVHIATSITHNHQLLSSAGLQVHPLKLHRSGSGLIAVLQEFFELYFVIRSISPDVVHLVTIKPVLLGGIASRLAHVSAVVSAISGLGHIFVATGTVAYLRMKLVSMLYHMALGNKNQLVIFQNSDDRVKLNKIVKNISNHSAIIPGSGVDLSIFTNMPLPSGIPNIMLASRLLKEKGVYEFVEASKIVNQFSKVANFVLVGDPDPLNPSTVLQGELDNWQEQGIVELIGWSGAMHEVISSATIVTLPSFYGEGLPKILIEAAACGRAVVTTDHPGCRDAIEEGVTGLLVPVRDAKALARAINTLLDDPERCAEMGRAGRRRAEELFDVSLVVEKHMEIYQRLLSCQ